MQQLIKKLSEPKTLGAIAIFFTVCITILLLIPSQGILPKQDGIPYDKLAHFVINCILIICWLLFFYAKENKMMAVTTIYAVFGLCLLYGIIIETLQYMFTTYRQADLLDVVANILGLLVGVGLFNKVKNKILN
ncbi:VanZ family protein [Marixanthomonas spongiae]|uniref:VanZ-like domain-containing protein n=1 Tax=Marixanthomonas spongiae TaxID=2174845 RepID=A0A2U0I846_9FLAO|nr:VanZ family protein [Marixanthomonas spongiae]PVW17267.1 hypothetical protein DDV96_01790 [Marixanthomonas spongiae]